MYTKPMHADMIDNLILHYTNWPEDRPLDWGSDNCVAGMLGEWKKIHVVDEHGHFVGMQEAMRRYFGVEFRAAEALYHARITGVNFDPLNFVQVYLMKRSSAKQTIIHALTTFRDTGYPDWKYFDEEEQARITAHVTNQFIIEG